MWTSTPMRRVETGRTVHQAAAQRTVSCLAGLCPATHRRHPLSVAIGPGGCPPSDALTSLRKNCYLGCLLYCLRPFGFLESRAAIWDFSSLHPSPGRQTRVSHGGAAEMAREYSKGCAPGLQSSRESQIRVADFLR